MLKFMIGLTLFLAVICILVGAALTYRPVPIEPTCAQKYTSIPTWCRAVGGD